jgi:hypothetical protein
MLEFWSTILGRALLCWWSAIASAESAFTILAILLLIVGISRRKSWSRVKTWLLGHRKWIVFLLVCWLTWCLLEETYGRYLDLADSKSELLSSAEQDYEQEIARLQQQVTNLEGRIRIVTEPRPYFWFEQTYLEGSRALRILNHGAPVHNLQVRKANYLRRRSLRSPTSNPERVSVLPVWFYLDAQFVPGASVGLLGELRADYTWFDHRKGDFAQSYEKLVREAQEVGDSLEMLTVVGISWSSATASGSDFFHVYDEMDMNATTHYGGIWGPVNSWWVPLDRYVGEELIAVHNAAAGYTLDDLRDLDGFMAKVKENGCGFGPYPYPVNRKSLDFLGLSPCN